MMTVTKLPKPKPNPWINILNMLDVNQRLLKVFKALFLNKFYILMIKFDGIYSIILHNIIAYKNTLHLIAVIQTSDS